MLKVFQSLCLCFLLILEVSAEDCTVFDSYRAQSGKQSTDFISAFDKYFGEPGDEPIFDVVLSRIQHNSFKKASLTSYERRRISKETIAKLAHLREVNNLEDQFEMLRAQVYLGETSEDLNSKFTYFKNAWDTSRSVNGRYKVYFEEKFGSDKKFDLVGCLKPVLHDMKMLAANALVDFEDSVDPDESEELVFEEALGDSSDYRGEFFSPWSVREHVDEAILRLRDKIARYIVWDDSDSSLSVTFEVKLSPTGDIVDLQISNSSNNHNFDQAVLRAIKLAGPLPIPTDDILFKEFFSSFGLTFAASEVAGGAKGQQLEEKRRRAEILAQEKKIEEEKRALAEEREAIEREKKRIAELERSGKERQAKEREERNQRESLRQASSGTGFAVSKDGFIVTNQHVIDSCQGVQITSTSQTLSAEVVAFDLPNDLAVLKANFSPSHVFPIRRRGPILSEDIYVAGFPFGFGLSTSLKVTKGVISSLSGIGNNFSNIQIDAALQPGNSGGPILDEKGNVVGVAVAKLDRKETEKIFGAVPENINFGIKANVVISILQSVGVEMAPEETSAIDKARFGDALSDGTYYITCWMTAQRIEEVRKRKVLFEDFSR